MSSERTALLLVPFVVFLYGLAGGQNQPDCGEARFEECKEILIKPHHFQESGPVYSQEQIHQGCSELLEADRCVNEMLQSCPELASARPTLQPENVKKIRSCRILADKYVQKIGCYEALNETYQKCLEHEKNAFPTYVQNLVNGNRELQQEACCNIQQIFACMLSPTGEKCDSDARDTLADFLNWSLPDQFQATCDRFQCQKPDQDEINEHSSHDGHEHFEHDGHQHKKETDENRIPSTGATAFQDTTVVAALSLAIWATVVL